jgi:hypothetical protein
MAVISRQTLELTPEQARSVGSRFGHQADVETTTLIRTMDESVQRMQAMIQDLDSGVTGMKWQGRRASAFDGQWTGEFKPAMVRMQESIRDFRPVLVKMQACLQQAQADLNRFAADVEAIDVG